MLQTDESGTPQRSGAVVRVDQECIDLTNAWDVRPLLLRALYAQGPEVWVDLGRVTFIDSTGLGMLLEVLREARQMGGHLHLAHRSPEVERALKVTGLDLFF